MWSLFFVIFVGGFWLFKIIDDKAETECHQKEVIKVTEIRNELKVPISLENDISAYLRDEVLRMESLRQISAELKEIYGENWISEFRGTYSEDHYWMADPWSIAFHLILAKKGLLPSIYSYKLGYKSEQLRKIQIHTCHIIENLMRQKHPTLDLKLVFVPGMTYSGYGKNIHKIYYEEVYRGKLIWNFEVISGMEPDVREFDFW